MNKSRERKKENLFVVGGQRELSRALEMGYKVDALFYKEGTDESIVLKGMENTFELSNKLFEQISMRSGSEEVIAIMESVPHRIEDLTTHTDQRILVLESPEKPGNIGALLRTAAAADWDAVIIANPRTDLYHPQIIRNSMGGVFSIPIACDDTVNVISFLKKNDFNIIAAALHSSAKHFKRIKYSTPMALVMGTEDNGLEPLWMKEAHQTVKIPVKFPIDSLNLSVSAGILMYHYGNQ